MSDLPWNFVSAQELHLPWKISGDIGVFVENYRIVDARGVTVTDVIQLSAGHYPDGHALKLANMIVESANRFHKISKVQEEIAGQLQYTMGCFGCENNSRKISDLHTVLKGEIKWDAK